MNWRYLIVVFVIAVAGPPLAVRFGQLAAPCYSAAAPSAPGDGGELPTVEQTVLLHFWRPNCPVSVKTEARARALRQRGLPIRSYNTLTRKDKSREYRIDATPTFILIEGGDELYRFSGGLSSKEIVALLDRE
ncbi:MAG: thioredoxin family protein [Planctomycetales bacterium]|nr:thioredoxin family protein [Planctomycetales bacterium]